MRDERQRFCECWVGTHACGKAAMFVSGREQPRARGATIFLFLCGTHARLPRFAGKTTTIQAYWEKVDADAVIAALLRG